MRVKKGADGFTLVELLIAIVILGAITIPLGSIVVGYFHTADATSARMLESHDAQIASAYWAQDVASIGRRSTTSPYPLDQSVWTGVSSLYSCPSGGTPIVTLAWDEFTPTGESTVVQVVYVVQTVSGHAELHRVRCEGSAAAVTDLIVAHDLDASTPPTVTCRGSSGANCAASGSGVPQTVALCLTIRDSRDLGAPYTITLTGQRRQS